MYKIVPWTEELDLTEFYAEAEKRKLINNSTKKMLVDSLAKEKEWRVWILYYNNRAVGSVGAHSFPEMGNNAYRVAVRTCAFSDLLPLNTLRTANQIVTHQHVTSQFLIPACLEWVPLGSKCYITSTDSDLGTQRLVHRIFGPAMEKTGQMRRVCDLHYRNTDQTVWELIADNFYEALRRYPRW
jgi:hypothetical protein